MRRAGTGAAKINEQSMNGSNLWSNRRDEDGIAETEGPKMDDIHPVGGDVHIRRPPGSEAVPVLELEKLTMLQ